MEKKQQELTQLSAYTKNVEKELTLLLQNLQWDPKHTAEKATMVTCRHDSNHKMPVNNRDVHEKQCYLAKFGYTKDDTYLPDPVDPDAETLVKLSEYDVAEIINKAAVDNPLFKRGVGCEGSLPLTAERLQQTYTSDERCAIHDAVVNAVPYCHDLTDLSLLSSNDEGKANLKKSRLEILAELRDMKRRRTKYRVAPKTRNYSDVLRDVIKTQMDSYGEATKTIIKTEYGHNIYVSQNVTNKHSENMLSHGYIKLEKESHDSFSRERFRGRSREKKYVEDRREFIKEKMNSERNRKYNDCNLEKRREKRRDDDDRRYNTDNYTSKGQSRVYNDSHQVRNSSHRSREDRYNNEKSRSYQDYLTKEKHDRYYANDEKDRKGTKLKYDIKQEKSFHNDTHMDYSRYGVRDRSKSIERRGHGSKKSNEEKYLRKDRSEVHRLKYSVDSDIDKSKQNDLSENDYEFSKSSRKRYKSSSKDRKHKHKKNRHDKSDFAEKSREHDIHRKQPEMSTDIVIKLEKNSP